MKKTTRDAIVAALKAARDIADVAEGEDRDLSGEEREKVNAYLAKAAELKKRDTDATELRDQLSGLTEGIGLTDPDEPKPAPPAHFAKGTRGVSIGQQFAASDEYTSLVKSVPGGRFGEKMRIQSAPYGLKSLINITDPAAGGTLLVPEQLGMLDPFYQRPLTIRSLVSPGTTQTDTISYVRMLSTTINAAPVPEASTTAVVGGGVTTALAGVKPESGFTFERDTTNVKTIAHWIPATKRSLSDASQIRTLIDTFLVYGLEQELEDQILSGDGTGENFLGLAHTGGVQTQAAPGAGEDVFNVTRKARTKVTIGGRSIPTAYVMNPLDWESIELMRNTQGNFYGAGPFALSTPSLWALPVVASEAVPVGTAYVADWKKAILWDREAANIQVTDSHADFFIRNLVAILAEMRAAFAILRPSAFVKIALV